MASTRNTQQWMQPDAFATVKAFVAGKLESIASELPNVTPAMKKNVTVRQAMHDLGHRYPMVAALFAASANNSATEIMATAAPDYYTVRKLEARLKGDKIDDDEEEIFEDEPEVKQPVLSGAKNSAPGSRKLQQQDIDALLEP